MTVPFERTRAYRHKRDFGSNARPKGNTEGAALDAWQIQGTAMALP